ncbi:MULTISPECIES: HlyD family efflux transporter periplasmic adaptor subunit [unclassified Bradyrhizobium]|uniref:HlyD family efflux transporter periplasmic adaptor subunit n=1 Tax=unclassified Bradyrhizobium TaxID=2631580 RepID=UPI001FFA3F5D|nr:MULTISPECIES: HlyD family efflux transporter periplasmic adaptor subunit [unclassified Bradyrhizobium]MCK1269257.1 HlyD family efflux transporter periplasmic adaptor subunit [Bradyrhizobium sp. 84]MCK1325043.1 HlyD family efflux transporter periplasmic adaptor subunit [Bradyrhizobium sp. 156]MCK1374963.1 HlyD family efflux transporter periplasmic adaptor subunit [Bradyrhizobium sp. 49]MCK1417832.1 HlyD family efflux transporter periplasmic adaptor subunit [Bradyrhizobium sp. CW4]MCK1427366.
MANRPTLFRKEAVDFLHQRHTWGEVVLLQPLSSTLLSWSLAALVVFILCFLSIAQYARKETVSGYLTPTSGTAKIFISQQGFIKAIHVKEGQEVAGGDPLLTIVTSQITANGDDVNATVLAVLTQQRNVVERQIDAEDRRTASERDRLGSTIKGIEGEIIQLEDQRNIQNERLKLSESFVSTGAKLTASGALPTIELKRREQAALEQKQSVVSLDQQITARHTQLTDARHTLEQLPTIAAERIRGLRNELSSIEQRVAEVNGRQAYVIKAPTSGRVSTLQATIGQIADPRHMQLEIIPVDAPLQAELFFPTRAFGFVRPGQQVRILYDAFPYQKFGTYRGSVTNVSHTILTGNETTGPIALKEPAYRVTAALERPDIDAYGRKMPLQPDMLLRADVILEQRSLMSWLLDPVLSARM